MAIARGAGTEIIRSASFEDIDTNNTTLIVGVQHHIYTVLSVSIRCYNNEGGTQLFYLNLKGYDSKAGTTNRTISLMASLIATGDTFVWNDKFSFNGYEPVNFTGPMDDATKQDAIADHGSSVSQYLFCSGGHADDNYEVHVTYIDQNNA